MTQIIRTSEINNPESNTQGICELATGKTAVKEYV